MSSTVLAAAHAASLPPKVKNISPLAASTSVTRRCADTAPMGTYPPPSPLPPAATYALCFAMGAVTASLTLSWACAKEVNPPLLSGMATSVVNVGVFLGPSILQPLVGWVMDQGWQGAMEGGARLYAASDYRGGLFLLAGFAALGAAATFFVRETGCRNVWSEKASSLKP